MKINIQNFGSSIYLSYVTKWFMINTGHYDSRQILFTKEKGGRDLVVLGGWVGGGWGNSKIYLANLSGF